MGIGALFEHENHRGTGLKLIADRFLLLIVRKMLDVTQYFEVENALRLRDLPCLANFATPCEVALCYRFQAPCASNDF